MQLTSHMDMQHLVLDGVVAVVSSAVIAAGIALPHGWDLQLRGQGTLGLPSHTGSCGVSVPGECDVSCAFGHRAEEYQIPSFDHRAPGSPDLEAYVRDRHS